MREAIILLFFAACSFVSAEKCTTNSDCVATRCGTGFHVICEHPQNAGVTKDGGLCTCAADNVSCTSKDDCAVILELTCTLRIHCYDGKCICSRW